ncbi:MAG: T9SS type A sorting domain-containing protein [Candidatus Latescibacteria bacterium]|nr:T9SS type A sorting domain-containing protein [Candidatus Latescibacterota bacterium]NIO55417.1 T9SS type A sorting domain-containing protein [Candidatus Latescibacterota bacterium]
MKSFQSVIGVLLVYAVLFVLLPCVASAQWIPDGTPVCTALNEQDNPQVISDGSGGVIIAWHDLRSGSGIYAQRVDGSGNVLWTVNGEVICAANGANPALVSDGLDGAIIVWQDSRSGSDIYAQRVDGSGNVLWTVNGVAICTASGIQEHPALTSDGLGGAIITWQDERSDVLGDIYAQRVDGLGTVQWTANGIPICTETDIQGGPVQLESDGSGGAIITWIDRRAVATTYFDIYAQRVDGSGNVQWTVNGVPVCNEYGIQLKPFIVSDGSGGAIITWEDARAGQEYERIYAQRVDGSGNVQWTVNGVRLTPTVCCGQYNPAITSDGTGGAIITWQDERSGTSGDIYAQRVDGSGIYKWGSSGVAISTTSDHQAVPVVTFDGSGGAIIAWLDYSGVGGASVIYTQHVNGLGNVQWAVNGVAVSPTTSDNPWATVASDGSGGAIIAWEDRRSDAGDIYAQHVAACPVGEKLYVDVDANGSADGSSWGDAFTELRDALNWLVGAPVTCSVTEIWVAEGTYKPTGGSDRSATFRLYSGVEIYGGFEGTETMRSERDPDAHPTILSGDIGVSDSDTDNSYHVVNGSGADATAVLDGFTVTRGRSDSTSTSNGGGIYILNGSPSIANAIISENYARFHGGGMSGAACNSVLTNVIFLNNSSLNDGGGLSIGGNAELTHVTFSGNSANRSGGGMFNSGSNSQSLLTEVIFLGNSSRDGGGMFNTSATDPVLVNVTFSGNLASRYGGGIYSEAGCNPELTNIVFSQNTANDGGGMFNTQNDFMLVNVSFSGNIASNRGGGIYNNLNNATLTNTILWGNSAATAGDEIYVYSSTTIISHSLIEGGLPSGCIDAGNNIDADPMFKGADFPNTPLAIYSSSPGINAGDNTAVPLGVTTDLEGNPRIYGANVDMGAYEHQGPPTGIDDGPEYTLPTVTALRSAHPNPFNPSVTLVYDLDSNQDIQLAIYDVQGKLVRKLVDGYQTAGTHEVRWNGTDGGGNAMASGVYFVRLRWAGRSDHRKIVLLK